MKSFIHQILIDALDCETVWEFKTKTTWFLPSRTVGSGQQAQACCVNVAGRARRSQVLTQVRGDRVCERTSFYVFSDHFDVKFRLGFFFSMGSNCFTSSVEKIILLPTNCFFSFVKNQACLCSSSSGPLFCLLGLCVCPSSRPTLS